MPLYFASILIAIFAVVLLIMAMKEKSYEMFVGGLAILFGAIAFFFVIRLVGIV
ncbi:MAG: hypothetical protein AAB337_00225 [Patescibacteria group bacterium]